MNFLGVQVLKMMKMDKTTAAGLQEAKKYPAQYVSTI